MTSKGLFHKLAKAQQIAKPIPKNGFNKFANYKYVKDEDLMEEAKRCLEHGGLVSYSSTEIVEIDNSSEQKRATVLQTVHVVDPESGESFSTTMPGQAFDKNGDKAIYKASTGANKYAYMRLLCLSTGEDPEDDGSPQDEVLLAGILALVHQLEKGKGIQKAFWAKRYGISTTQMTNAQLKKVRQDLDQISRSFTTIQEIKPFGGFN